ncbi:MAG: GHKL domain-containing protein [Lachnospiraceae bacterium]|nr:GHKL domain-containing protein [Lachnospiraceae bacterium]
MTLTISFFNYVAVAIFGCVLSAVFCKIPGRKREIIILTATTAMILLMQGIINRYFGLQAIRSVYPLVTHLPLILVLWYLQKRLLWSVVAVLTAYSCCQLRAWAALFVGALLKMDENALQGIELILTPLIFILILLFAARPIQELAQEKTAHILRIGIIPALYYLFDYFATVYSETLYNGTMVVVEFMPFVCSLSYLLFMAQISMKNREYQALEYNRRGLDMQIKQAVKEMEVLRESHEQAAIYRHDLRHHLQYLFGCIDQQKLEQAKEYIQGICHQMEAAKVVQYCENEATNLVLSTYADKAKQEHIAMDIQVSLGKFLLIADEDMGVLLSNALENALHECEALSDSGGDRFISVHGYSKDETGKIFLQIINSCREGIRFYKGMPITDKPGHGVGTYSIRTIVERYRGICSFSEEDRRFVLRISV